MFKILFKLEDPITLLFLLIIPVMSYRYVKKREGAAIKYSSLEIIKRAVSNRLIFLPHIPFILRIIAIILIVIAIARPQSGRKSSEIVTSGVDIMLTLDTSGSMNAMDFTENGKRATRLAVVKRVVNDFIKKRKYDRIGMVVFGSDAYTQSPLTLDYGILLTFLASVSIGMAGEETAVGSALATSVKRLKDLKSKSKIIILLTDGRSNMGTISPEVASDIAKTYNIKVYTIGVGTEGAAPFLVDSFFGKTFVYQEVDLDEDTLRMIANKTGGKYFRATDAKKLENIYEEIDELEKSEVKVKEYFESIELYPYFVTCAILLLLIEFVLNNTILRRIP